MDLKKIVVGPEVGIPEVLDARENRVRKQRALQKQYPMTLISFTLNIPGPVKVFPLGIRSFQEGMELIACRCRAMGFPVLHREEVRQNAGWEGYFSVRAPAENVKRQMAELEDGMALGRLFDIDVLDQRGEKCSRTQLGLPERGCLLCEKPAFVCSRSRAHSVQQLLTRAAELMEDYFREKQSRQIVHLAARALLEEVMTTPKPGLVDRNNSGAHRDMDVSTFEVSTLTLLPWFRTFLDYGRDHCREMPESLLPGLKEIGIRGETEMLQATGGVNTHRGVIFSLGILLCSLGICLEDGTVPERDALRALCRRISSPLQRELKQGSLYQSHGMDEFAKHGLRGARGEAMDGFPVLFETAMPVLRSCLSRGLSLNDGGVITLLHIVAEAEDTNIAARASCQRMNSLREQLRAELQNEKDPGALLELAESLDRSWTAENISPGGSADLLALAYFLYFLEEQGIIRKE